MPAGRRQQAATEPVARLMVDVPLAHLDRPFDYLVSAELDQSVAAGSRVRVRFAGRLVDGYVLERTERSDHEGNLAWVERAVGEPVLTPETTRLFRAVADRWAGSFVDVVRLGVPARHAAAEKGVAANRAEPAAAPGPPAAVSGPGWARYRAGPAFLSAVADGRPARAAWSALPAEDWTTRIAEAVATAVASDRGAVVVVPDGRDLSDLDTALAAQLGPGRHVALSADLGPAERYRRWLAVLHGTVRVAIGTRAAAYAPVRSLGLLAVWDDGDDLLAEPRAPYPHVRDVLVLRSTLSGAALLLGGYARSVEAQLLVSSGWAHEIAAERRTLRAVAPLVSAVGDEIEQARDAGARAARLPSLAWRTAREALAAGRPVLVQVPRRGYVPTLSCARDRSPARCPACHGPLAVPAGGAVPSCRWCGRPAGDWSCPVCGERRLRAVVVGSARTAEELGRAFPQIPVRSSAGEHILTHVPDTPALVVATPGAEPVAAGGYGAVLLLDGWALLGRADLRAGEETLRRWLNAAALATAGCPIVVAADAAVPVVQALIRWDPAGLAARELAERRELRFPPAVRMAAVTGAPAAVADLLAVATLPDPREVIGPVPVGEGSERMLIRVPRSAGAELAAALHAAAAVRSARKAPDAVKIQLDPPQLF